MRRLAAAVLTLLALPSVAGAEVPKVRISLHPGEGGVAPSTLLARIEPVAHDRLLVHLKVRFLPRSHGSWRLAVGSCVGGNPGYPRCPATVHRSFDVSRASYGVSFSLPRPPGHREVSLRSLSGGPGPLSADTQLFLSPAAWVAPAARRTWFGAAVLRPDLVGVEGVTIHGDSVLRGRTWGLLDAQFTGRAAGVLRVGGRVPRARRMTAGRHYHYLHLPTYPAAPRPPIVLTASLDGTPVLQARLPYPRPIPSAP